MSDTMERQMPRRGERTKLIGKRKAVMVGKSNAALLSGEVDLSTWDEEELRRGRKRDKNGGWRGIDPKVVPKVVHDELVKRTLADANRMFNENLVAAVEVLTKIMVDPTVEPKDRLKAVQMVVDRTMGKSPEKVEVKTDAPWMVALQGAIVSVEKDQDQHELGDDEELDED